jgi:hypothetical protein
MNEPKEKYSGVKGNFKYNSDATAISRQASIEALRKEAKLASTTPKSTTPKPKKNNTPPPPPGASQGTAQKNVVNQP